MDQQIKTMMNGKELCKYLKISNTLLVRFRKAGMPYHQLGNGRKYYIAEQVTNWLKQAGYHQESKWTK